MSSQEVGKVVDDEREYECAACNRKFLSTRRDIALAGGHLCIAADKGLTQRQAIEELQRA